MNTQSVSQARQSYLDALRAIAMLLGIVLHASLSFFPSFWMVSDRRQDDLFAILFSAIHGFRMPLFFVMSGYFSAMLLHRRGLGSLVRHRFRRVFLPLVAGVFTIIPITMAISNLAMSGGGETPDPSPAAASDDLWSATRTSDLDAIERHLASGMSVESRDPARGGTPLLWAAATGQADALKLLIDRGADVNAADAEGGTGLHAAAFLGHEDVVKLLIDRGADVNAANGRGETPLDGAVLDEGTTRYFAGLLKLDLKEEGLGPRKASISETLRRHGAKAGRQSGLANLLMQIPVFNHLWFLWFLWWLVLGYAAFSAIVSKLPTPRLPSWVVLSPARYLWLIPLTMIPQWFMGDGGATPIFGPDTSTGLLPIPHVLAYYAVFFGFGALYFGFDGPSARVGERWYVPLGVGLAIVLPLGLALIQGWNGISGYELSTTSRRILSVFLQSSYPWLLTFGLMGVFRHVCPVESPRMQYLSDSAYWLYLAHLPLIIAAQMVVRDWPIPAFAKFSLIVVVVTAFLLWTYQVMVRYTWLGRFLNGPRARPITATAPAVVA